MNRRETDRPTTGTINKQETQQMESMDMMDFLILDELVSEEEAAAE